MVNAPWASARGPGACRKRFGESRYKPTISFGGNPVPESETLALGSPEVGLRVRLGVDDAIPAAASVVDKASPHAVANKARRAARITPASSRELVI